MFGTVREEERSGAYIFSATPLFALTSNVNRPLEQPF